MCPDCGDPRFFASELEPIAPAEALFHIVPVPLEATVSYGKGTANGPAAILDASNQMEVWDGESTPADCGIYTWPAVDCTGPVREVLGRVEKAVDAVLDLGKMPVLLGGEHTLTYGALAALRRRHGRFGLVQFDAHADLRDHFDDDGWSHGCVMRRAVADLDLPLVQFGVRAMCVDEVDARRRYGVTAYDGAFLAGRSPRELDALPDLLPRDFPEQIYVTFDVDGLDPAVIPATGTPVPGGIGWYEALTLAGKAMYGRRVLGFDVVELAPAPHFHASNFAAARLVYALMGLVQRRARAL